MTEQIADKVTNRLIEYQLIEAKQKELYHYMIQIQLEKMIGIIPILILSIIFKEILPTVVFLYFFFSIRKRSGGFHLNSFGGCFIGTTAVYLFYVLVLNPFLLQHLCVNYVVLGFAVIGVLLLGAVNHPNMEWDEAEYRASKCYSRMIVIVEALCISIFAIVQADIRYTLFMSYGVILSATLLVLGKLIKQEVDK